jgi:hypothetical protein
MKVKELIKKLSEFDGEMKVQIIHDSIVEPFFTWGMLLYDSSNKYAIANELNIVCPADEGREDEEDAENIVEIQILGGMKLDYNREIWFEEEWDFKLLERAINIYEWLYQGEELPDDWKVEGLPIEVCQDMVVDDEIRFNEVEKIYKILEKEKVSVQS